MLRSSLRALIFLTVLTNTAKGQSRQTINQAIEWFSTTSNIKVHEKVSLTAEGQFRFAGSFDPMQFQVRTGVEISLKKGWSFVPVGYVYTWNPIYGKLPNTFANNEHRIWEQVVYKHQLGRVRLSHRLRAEQRFMQVHVNTNGEIVNQGYDLYTNRLRYRLMANVPLNHTDMSPRTFYLSFYDELFKSWGKNVTYDEPDQNRFFTGFGYQISKHVSFQAGFLYQIIIKASGTKQENNLGLQVMLTHNFDLTK